MVSISITVRSYTNNLDERGLLVVEWHVSSFLVLSHLSHHRHTESEGNTGREEETNASRTIDTRLHAIFARLHFRSQPEIGRSARSRTFHLELEFADPCHRSYLVLASPQSVHNGFGLDCDSFLLETTDDSYAKNTCRRGYEFVTNLSGSPLHSPSFFSESKMKPP
jgi:hypothetical protein